MGPARIEEGLPALHSIGPKPTVLLVHPDAVTRTVVASELADAFEFVCASSGEQAERMYLTRRPDVIVVDDGVTDTTPRSLVEGLRELDPRLRAVFLVERRPDAVVWRLAELGTVLANRSDLERLRVALFKEVRALHSEQARTERAQRRAEDETRRDAPESIRKSGD